MIEIDLRNIDKEYFMSVENSDNEYLCIRDHIAVMKIESKVILEISTVDGIFTKLNTEHYSFKNGDKITVYIDEETDENIVPDYIREVSENQRESIYNIVDSLNVRSTNKEIHKLFIYNKEHIIDEEGYALSKNKEFFPEFFKYYDRRDAIKLATLRKEIILLGVSMNPDMKYKALIATKYPILTLNVLTHKQRMIGAGMIQYRRSLSSSEFNNMISVVMYPWKTEEEKVLLHKLQDFSMQMGKRGLIL